MPKGQKSYSVGGGEERVICPCGYVATGRTAKNTKTTMRLHSKYCNATELSLEEARENLRMGMKVQSDVADRKGMAKYCIYKREIEPIKTELNK